MEAKSKKWIEESHVKISNNFFKDQRILSFNEYIQLMEKEGHNQIRSSTQYTKDMIDYFGTNEDGSFKLFKQEFENSDFRLISLKEVQKKIYKILEIFVEEGMNNKLILLHGSNGSAKTSITNCIFKGLEHYSHQEEGSLYRFHWIFPVNDFGKPGFGLRQEKSFEKEIDSYAKINDEEISSRISCNLKDHPLFYCGITKEIIKKY